jgi:hypothetical protein
MSTNPLFARLALSVVLGAPLIAAAQQPAPSSPKPDAQVEGLAAPAASQVMGTLSKVDATANLLTVKKADNQEQSFALDPAAKITLDGKAASISQLKEGQKVSITVDGTKAKAVSATTASSSS